MDNRGAAGRLFSSLASLALAVALPGAAAAGCSQQLSIHTAANPHASFATYRTFSFGPTEGPPGGYQVSPRSAEVQRRLQPLVAAALTEKGYSLASGKADFYIKYGSGRRTVPVKVGNDEPRYKEFVNYDESAVSPGWSADDETADFVEGSLVIDGFDGATGGKVWHGASQAKIDPDHLDDGLLKRSVEALLASFPGATAARPQ